MMKENLKHLGKGLLLSLISAALIVTAVPLTASAYDSKSETYYEEDFTETLNLKNSRQQAVVEYLYSDYLNGNNVYKGSGECYGYAEKIRKMFGTGYKQRNYGVKATKSNFYKKLKKLRTGSHIRLSGKKNGGGSAHSVVLLKVTKDTIWYTDGNVDYNNGIRFSEEPLDYFCWRMQQNGKKYFAWAREPKGSVPAVKGISIKAGENFDGTVTRVAWRPVKKAKKYIVYRSKTKKSGYVKIAETKFCRYVDTSEDLYGKVYYKVKAVKSGKSSYSKPAKACRRLKMPVVYLTADKSSEVPEIDLSWDAVPGATKYRIYKWNSTKGKEELVKTVSGTSWHYTGSSEDYFLDFYVTAKTGRSGSESMPAQVSYSTYSW